MTVKTKRLVAVVGVLVLITLIGVSVVGTVLAQSETPTPAPDAAPKTPFGLHGFGRGGSFWGGSTADFDAVAKALNLTPTQLFEQLHSGKTLDEIAKAQGVDLTKVQEAANASRIQAMKDAIAQAVKDGKLTQAQADWLLQGLEKGYMGKGRGCDFGPMGQGGRGGMRGHGMQGPSQTPATPAPGTSS
jgi:hypothetical protein